MAGVVRSSPGSDMRCGGSVEAVEEGLYGLCTDITYIPICLFQKCRSGTAWLVKRAGCWSGVCGILAKTSAEKCAGMCDRKMGCRDE